MSLQCQARPRTSSPKREILCSFIPSRFNQTCPCVDQLPSVDSHTKAFGLRFRKPNTYTVQPIKFHLVLLRQMNDPSPAVTIKRLQTELANVSRSGALPPFLLRLSVKEEPDGAEDLTRWVAIMGGAAESAYEQGCWRLDVRVPAAYPLKPPEVRFSTRICHPNVDFKVRTNPTFLATRWIASHRQTCNQRPTLTGATFCDSRYSGCVIPIGPNEHALSKRASRLIWTAKWLSNL